MNIQRIRDLREDSDYTQEYIAKLLNVNQRTYSRYENGEHAIPLTILSFLQTHKKPSPKNAYSYLLLMHEKLQRYQEKADKHNASQPYRSRDKGTG